MSHKSDLPGWFPFAVVASAVLVIAAGVKSGWRLAADQPKPTPPSPVPPVSQAGVLQDWLGAVSPSRWFFWYVLPYGASQYVAHGPENLTDQDAFQLEATTKATSLGAQLYRFVWIPASGTWVYDARTDPALLASREIRDASGNVVG